MPPRKRSRRGGKSVTTAVNQQDDFRNLQGGTADLDKQGGTADLDKQGGTADLDKLITWLEDFDMQCNFLLFLDYKSNISIVNLNCLSQL